MMPRLKQLQQSLTLLSLFGLVSCATANQSFRPVQTPELESEKTITQIAFGSCAHQDKPQPIWRAIQTAHPDLLLLLGDNIYGDTHDPATLRERYRKFGESENFRNIRTQIPLLAVWDDHDYGLNDDGMENPNKKESQKIFLEFFQEPHDSARWKREGLYDSRILGPAGKRVQIILLDTRYFRGPLAVDPHKKTRARYIPSSDTSSSMLGETQWKWLEEELKKPAEVRILVSSIQVVAHHHGWEKWMNLPHERRRLFDLIGKTQAKGVVILSGDRHMASLAKESEGVPYPLFDLTGSSLANPLPAFLRSPEPDPQRLSTLYPESNFGWLQIDWEKKKLRMEIRDVEGHPVFHHDVSFTELAPKS